jgi:hypothetical protein
MQRTSWEGIYTNQLRKQGKLRGGYTRYNNRKNRSGLQIVKNREFYNDIYSPDGRFLGREIKYQNYATQDRIAKQIFMNKIKPNIPSKLMKQVIR